MTPILLSLILSLGLACGDKDDTGQDGGGGDGGGGDGGGDGGDGGGTDGGGTDGGGSDGGGADGGGADGGGADGGGADGGADGGFSDGGFSDGGGSGDGGFGDGGGTGDGGFDGGGTGDGGFDGGGTGDGGLDGGGGDGGFDGGGGDGGSAEDCMEWTVSVLNSDGAICTTCPSTGDFSFVAQVANTCDFDVYLTTRTACLVDTWTLEASKEGEAWTEACKGSDSDWTIPAFGAISESTYRGRLDIGEYELGVRFNTSIRHEASTRFVVE